MVIGISDGCKRFIQRFTGREIPVIRRGMALDTMLLDEVWKKKVENMSGSGVSEGMSSWEEIVLPHQREYIIWFVGRLVALKWVDLLIRAIAWLRIAGYAVSCQIVGDGDARQSLEKLVDELGLWNVVRFRWAMAREAVVRDFLPQVDIIVNPSYQEWLPTSVLEWLLTGCVVVATDVGGTPEISENGDLMLVKPGDVVALQSGLGLALQRYDEVVGRSRLEVRRRFSWERAMGEYADKLVNLI
jgi:glycosyltransferase involved in cell wall biosynthesis